MRYPHTSRVTKQHEHIQLLTVLCSYFSNILQAKGSSEPAFDFPSQSSLRDALLWMKWSAHSLTTEYIITV